MHNPVMIVGYNSKWPDTYQIISDKLLNLIGHRIISMEHFGSTAVPGLGGKQIIDILAGVGNKKDADDCIRLLKKEFGSIEIIPQGDHPEWYYCVCDKLRPGDSYHLHLVKFMSEFWKRQLLFRDILRTNPDIANRYYKLKKELALKYPPNRDIYQNEKSSFIEKVIRTNRLSEE